MKNFNDLIETINQFGSIDIVEHPGYLAIICEYVIMNGVKSNWEVVCDAMQGLRVGDKKVERYMRYKADGPSLEDYVSRMYRYIFNLYKIWGKDSWIADGNKYVESKEDMFCLSYVCHRTIDFLNEHYYDEEE